MLRQDLIDQQAVGFSSGLQQRHEFRRNRRGSTTTPCVGQFIGAAALDPLVFGLWWRDPLPVVNANDGNAVLVKSHQAQLHTSKTAAALLLGQLAT